MLFVGGPMHGRPVPEDLPRFLIVRVDSTGITEQTEILQVPVLSFDGSQLVEVKHQYSKLPYWRLGKPILWFFGEPARDPDELAGLCRELFGL